MFHFAVLVSLLVLLIYELLYHEPCLQCPEFPSFRTSDLKTWMAQTLAVLPARVIDGL